MTTANLSVGLNTRPAKQELDRFKALLKAELGGVKVSVDAKGAASEIQRALRAVTVKATIDTASIVTSAEKALATAFNRSYQVRLDTGNLTAQVQAAVTAGMGGAKLGVGGGGSIGDVAGIKSVIQQILTPAVDELAKAAALVGGTARRIGTGTGGPGVLQASSRFASTDPVTGERISVSRKLENPEGVLANVKGSIADQRRQAEQDALNREGARVGPNWDQLNAARDRAALFARRRAQAEQDSLNRDGARVGPDWTALNAARDRASLRKRREMEREQAALNREGSQVGPDRDTLMASRDRVALMRRRRAEAEQEALNREGAQVGPDFRTIMAARDRAAARRRRETEVEQAALNREGAQVGPSRDSLLAARDRVAAMRRRRAEAEQEALNREGAEVGPSRERLFAARDRAAAARRREVEAEQAALNREAAQFGPSRETIMRLRDQVAAKRRTDARLDQDTLNREAAQFGPSRAELLAARDRTLAEARAKAAAKARQEIEQFYASAQLDAAKQFKGAGVRISAAQATAQKFGVTETADVLGRNAGLLTRAGELDRYRRATDDAAAAKRRFADNMNDAHSAARGLAGSLGALWVTWGSTAPLVAGAAIGATLRAVWTAGKDVEYQLKFVQVLSDGTTVSLQKFGDAVRGSLTVPTQAAEAMRALAQNGLSVRQALQALPEILNLATVGEMGLAEAALGATGVMAAFNLQVNDLGRIGDVFAKAAALSNTSVSQMVESMRQASTVSDQYNVSLEETAASLATMAKRNITGSAAGTALRNMLVELATPHKRAKDAMAEMNLQLYDNSNQLRSYGEVLTELRAKTVTLNEKGRLTFLNELFGERGAKAANALLSDFEQYSQTLDQLKNKSKDFASSVADALKETTQGKIKALATEFQLSAVGAFEKAGGSVNYFLDSMRAAVSSEQFRAMLQSLVKGVTTLTTFMVENGKAVATTIAIWMGMRVAESLVTGIMAMTRAMIAAEAATIAVGRAARIAWASVTGGIGLVALLAAEFFLLRNNTNEAMEAQKQFGTRLALQSDDLERQNRQLAESNSLLERRIQLQRQGYSGAQADTIIAGESDVKAGDRFKTDVATAKRELEKARAEESLYQDRVYKRRTDLPPLTPEDGQRAQDRRALIPVLEANLEKAAKIEEQFRLKVSQKRSEDEKKEMDRRLEAMKKFNDRLYEIRTTDKSKGKALEGLFVTQGEATRGSPEAFNDLMKSREDALNKKLGSFTPKTSEARSEELASTRALIKVMNDEQAAFKQSIRFRKELEDARYSDQRFGPQLAAVLAEQRAIDGINESIRIEIDQRRRLQDALSGTNLNEADRRSIRAEMEHRQANIELLRTELSHRVQISALNATERARQASAEAALERSKLGGDDRGQVGKMHQDVSTKVEDSSLAAAATARMKVEERYRDAIVKREQDVKTAKEAIREIEKESLGDGAGYTQQELERVNAAHANLSVQQSLLDALKEQARVSADMVASTAIATDEYSKSAEYGFKKFWKDYQEQGTTAAKSVEEAMKGASSNMEDALAKFVTTGKLNFKELVGSIMADLARLAAKRAFMQVMNYAIGAWGGSGGAGGGGSVGTSMGGWVSGGGYSVGGAGAGMATGTNYVPKDMIALIHKGEAVVPKEFNPAAMGMSRTSEASAPKAVSNSVSVTVHLHGDGKSKTESDASGEKAGQLGQRIKQAVQACLVEEKRPGGLLYS